ncbi:MAG: hypothetical protein JW885_02745 [Deltaproteobacteria bacterium]|nr:hypothetical protein [Candidatus Zymogenaceae bacterium]
MTNDEMRRRLAMAERALHDLGYGRCIHCGGWEKRHDLDYTRDPMPTCRRCLVVKFKRAS